jgi:multicomponent Na+:H+ antiporter subunit G
MALVVALLLIAGGFFSLVAAIGVVRMPDVYIRMHATTKAGTLGVGLLLVAVALHFQDITVTSRVAGTVVFLLLTAPVGAHLLGRVLLRTGYIPWQPRDAGRRR